MNANAAGRAGLGGAAGMACGEAHVPPGVNQKWVFCLQGPAKTAVADWQTLIVFLCNMKCAYGA